MQIHIFGVFTAAWTFLKSLISSCIVSNDYGAYRQFNLRKFINSNEFLITHTKPQLSIKLFSSVCHFMLRAYSLHSSFCLFQIKSDRPLLLPSQLRYINADCDTSCMFDMWLVRMSSVCFCCCHLVVSRCAFASVFTHIHVIHAYVLIISQSSFRPCFA